MSEAPVVETVELTKVYGEFTALDHLSIRLEKGQILGFIGPNGAGKTTTIKILVGLIRPTSGKASIGGVDCTSDARKIKHLVGYMPDTFGSYDNMRVREYLDFFGAAFKIPRKQRQDRINASLATTGASHMADLYVESLSHGMKQRVAIARTLLHDPPVLILDEPANGLDPAARVEMREILLNLAQRGKTLIVTSHILPELARICNMVAIMTHGKLRAFGTLDQIMQSVRHQRMIEIQLLSEEDVTQAAEILRENLGETAGVTPALSEMMVRFNTTGNEQSLAVALQRLVSAQVRVSQFREMQQDLEDAFLSVTQQDKTELAAGEAQA
ncbi:MAG: ABC transporter ATP-binding protein [Phycisphaerae bacterium]